MMNIKILKKIFNELDYLKNYKTNKKDIFK